MLLAALMVMALYELYRWGEKGLKGVPWLGILCLSGAFLTKGPVGMALPCLVTAVFLWIRGMHFGGRAGIMRIAVGMVCSSLSAGRRRVPAAGAGRKCTSSAWQDELFFS